MVLILLGMVVLSVLMARNLSAYVKENLTVTVMLNDNVSTNSAKLLCRDLYHRPYSRDIDYISKEQAQKEQTEAMGSDPSEFLGFNPFSATLEVRLKADYVNRDSLKLISRELKKRKEVTDVAYQDDLMDKVNSNLHKINIILLVLAVLLTCVSFSLINNTVRLSIYARRFTIHTMSMVGATRAFIRRPFLVQALFQGICAALLATLMLVALLFVVRGEFPQLFAIFDLNMLLLTFGIVLAAGALICVSSTFLVVNRLVSLRKAELYY